MCQDGRALSRATWPGLDRWWCSDSRLQKALLLPCPIVGKHPDSSLHSQESMLCFSSSRELSVWVKLQNPYLPLPHLHLEVMQSILLPGSPLWHLRPGLPCEEKHLGYCPVPRCAFWNMCNLGCMVDQLREGGGAQNKSFIMGVQD